MIVGTYEGRDEAWMCVCVCVCGAQTCLYCRVLGMKRGEGREQRSDLVWIMVVSIRVWDAHPIVR